MLKAYKYRIYPNKEQRIQIAKTFGCCRFVYNQTLAYRKDIYEQEKKSLSKTDCNNYCNRELKTQYEWLKEADKFALTNAIYNMDSAYQKFFREHAGYPKFKSKHDNRKSYTTNFTNARARKIQYTKTSSLLSSGKFAKKQASAGLFAPFAENVCFFLLYTSRVHTREAVSPCSDGEVF